MQLSHLDFDAGSRGTWRKFNPYHPYTEDEKDNKTELKVESLDDLFEDDLTENTENKKVVDKPEMKVEQINDNILNDEAPVLPQENNEEEIMSIDVQKELEAKFDELFGPIEDENNN